MSVENLSSIFSSIWQSLKQIGKVIKILFLTFKNIIMFFKDPGRLTKLRENRNLLAICLKERQSNGEYNVVECLYDEQTEEIVGAQYHSLGISTHNLDNVTKQNFGNKDMIILK